MKGQSLLIHYTEVTWMALTRNAVRCYNVWAGSEPAKGCNYGKIAFPDVFIGTFCSYGSGRDHCACGVGEDV